MYVIFGVPSLSDTLLFDEPVPAKPEDAIADNGAARFYPFLVNYL